MEVVDSIRNPDGIWINTECFREEAKHFKKYGYYTDAPVGSLDHQLYWDEQERRCEEGYSVGGARITGDHYGYLNFSQIKLSKDDSETINNFNPRIKKSLARKKVKDFPLFLDGDYNYFHALDIARFGITPNELQKLKLDFNPLYIDGGRHLCVGKARRKGYSYKAAWVLANRYKQIPDSVSVVAAFDKKYLTGADGTMTMARNCIDFMNEHTDWARRKLINSVHHQKDGYIDNVNGVNIEKGYKSQIISVSCFNDPDAVRGKDGTVVYLEEAGKFPNLLDVYASTAPTLEDGKFVTGLMVIFGTGGGDDSNWHGFETIFYDPETYKMLPIENIWDEKANGTSCGFFHPDYVSKIGYVDKVGNSLKEKAKAEEEKEREERKAKSRDSSAVTKRKMEYPFSPEEAFRRSSNNNFPTDLLTKQYNLVMSEKLHRHIVHGKLEHDGEDGANFTPLPNAIPIEKFPHKADDELKGCISIVERPLTFNGEIPKNLYYICHDPYAFNTSTDGTSLGAAYVMMNDHNLPVGGRGDKIVASYVGRPDSQDTYNENLFLLAKFYNCKIGFENDRGDVIGYAKRHKLIKWLEPEFELGWSDKINNALNRGYGMSVGGGRENKKILQGDMFLRDWLLTKRGVTEDGEVIYNLNTIKDPALLMEFIRYGEGNFDRVSAMRIGTYYSRELIYKGKSVKKEANKKSSLDKFKKAILYQ